MDLTQFLDLVATTTAKYPVDRYRNHLIERSYVLRELMKQVKTETMNGLGWIFDAMIIGGAGTAGKEAQTSADGAGRYGPLDTLPLKGREFMTQGFVMWAYYTTNWVISSQEAALNKRPEGHIKLAKVKAEGVGTSFANDLEADFWWLQSYLHETGARPSILGFPYWITDDGFHINDPAGALGTPVGGISPTDARFNDASGVNRWRNQFIQITTFNEFLDALDTLFTNCEFEAPPDVEMAVTPQFKKYGIYLNTPSYINFKKLMRRAAYERGDVFDSVNPTFNNVKIRQASRMPARADGLREAYFVNKDTFSCAIEKDNNFRRDPVKPEAMDAKGQHIYLWAAIACEERRLNGKAWGWDDTLVEA